ncbi:MAG: hypothetical protein LBM41_06215 [Ruminococcus sp.]|jgi:hypothetical protein|nr:hypothetical protein [Ruminococcus sp.]
MSEKSKKKDRQSKLLSDNVSLGANGEMLGRYSEAAKQFKVAYDGVDNATGKTYHQSLKGIAESKVNPNYVRQNINQQAGYSAEVLDTAKQNAENIKHGNPSRVIRTDDLGRINDVTTDQVTLDANGNIVEGSGVQIKFLGADYKGNLSFIQKLNEKEYSRHYPEGKFRVPSDQYDRIKAELKQNIAKIERQSPLTPDKQNQLEYLKKVDSNLQKSDVSKYEAIEARKNPEKVTAKEIGKTSHQAGIESAKIGAAVGGGISLIHNMSAVLQGEKTPEEAVIDTVGDTAKSAATSYSIGFTNTAIAGLMKNSANKVIRVLGDSSAPAYIIQTAISTTKSLISLCKGEINVNEFFLEIGKSGTTMLAAAQGAVIGQVLIPIPVIGGIIGSLVSSLVCGVIYDYTIGMKMFNKEIDDFCEQLNNEMSYLKAYQAELMKLDIKKFQQETTKHNNITEFISSGYSPEDFNICLKLAYAHLNMTSPWGNRSFDNFMNDKSAVLTFE